MRGAITNDFIAVTLDEGLRVPFRGSRAGEIRGMTERIPLFAWEEAFPLEKNSGYPSPERHVPRDRSEAVHLTFQFLIGRTIPRDVHARTASVLRSVSESNFDRELKYFTNSPGAVRVA